MKESQKELTAANQRLLELATTDALTGAGNRRAFDERLAEEHSLACRHIKPLSMLLFDIDDFKIINDALGREVGDRVLQQVGSILREGSRASDLVYRYGGEEFALLLPNTLLDQALVLAERMRLTMEETYWQHRAVTISVGASSTILTGTTVPQPSNGPVVLDLHSSGKITGSNAPDAQPTNDPSASTLARQAELALDRAKTLGKNQVVAYEFDFEFGPSTPLT